jgi:hypothetical protein
VGSQVGLLLLPLPAGNLSGFVASKCVSSEGTTAGGINFEEEQLKASYTGGE